MQFLKKIFDFYVNSSIHVALSVYSLVRITQLVFHISEDNPTIYFVFFGTVFGYNFVKYDRIVRIQRFEISPQLKAIVIISFISFLAAGYFFFQLQSIAQVFGFVFLAITFLYTLPLFPNKKNARNWAGIKIYIVAFCWVGVTLVLPIINAEIPITFDFYLKCVQQFLLIFVLIIIFEIVDLQSDDSHLKTVPQQIGVERTKILGLVLLWVYFVLEVFNFKSHGQIKNQFCTLLLQLIIVKIIAAFLVFSNQHRSKYYTSFWVESIPIFWFFLILMFGKII